MVKSQAGMLVVLSFPVIPYSLHGRQTGEIPKDFYKSTSSFQLERFNGEVTSRDACGTFVPGYSLFSSWWDSICLLSCFFEKIRYF